MSEGTSRQERPERLGLLGLTVGRPIAMGVVFVTLVLLGFIAYLRIPLQFLPGGLEATRFSVSIPNSGASAQENHDKIASVVEEQFNTIQGIEDVRSYSSDDRVRFRVRFQNGTTTENAKAELRDRIERARPELPSEVDRVWLWSNGEADMPVVWFAIVATERTDDVTTLIDNYVQKRIEGIDGVSRVDVWGLLNESIRIFLDEDKVAAAQLDLGALVRRLSQDNFAQPLGDVTDGGIEYILRSDMRFKTLEDVRNYPVREDGLRIGDLGTVERVNSVRDSVTRIDGGYAYYGRVQKEGSANVVAVGREIQRVMEGFEADPRIGGRLKATVFFNQADFIESSIEQLESTAIQGGGLAVLVLFLFLRRARMTLCVALCIPVSALLAIAFENFSGRSFNVLTMTGLTLGIGMLVDNAVVIIESIARQRAMGHGPRSAAVLGVRDVGIAVTLATMTTVVVFLPLTFIGNATLSVYLKAMGASLCSSLIFSLIVALVFIPTAAARVISDRPRPVEAVARAMAPLSALPTRGLAWAIGGLRAAFYCLVRGMHAVERALLGALRFPGYLLAAAGVGYLGYRSWAHVQPLTETADQLEALGLPGSTIDPLRAAGPGALSLAGVAIVLLLIGAPLCRRRGQLAPPRPDRFVPQGDSVIGWIQSLNRGLLRWTLDHRILAVLLAFLAYKTIEIPRQETVVSNFGEDEDTSELSFWVDLEDNFTLGEASDEMKLYESFVEGYRDEFQFKHVIAQFDSDSGEIELRWPSPLQPKELEERRDRLRKELPSYPGHRVYFRGQAEISDSSKQFVTFEIRGTDPDELQQIGDRAAVLLSQVEGLTDVKTDVEEAPDQLLLELDGETAFNYGLNSQSALQNVGWALRGAQLARFQEQDREVPLLIEYDSTAYAGLETLRDLTVWGDEGAVALSTISNIRFQQAPSRIVRRNGRISTSITARVSDPTAQAELVTKGYDALEALGLPRGYSLGRDDSVAARSQEELAELMVTLLLSLLFVFILMAILFESLLMPLSVMTTIPFAMLGAFWTLYLTGTALDSIGWIGIIILVGVVVNNGIVLIDKIHRLRVVDGLSRRDAVIEGAAARVRPILMTALTTVVGLLPMALGDAPAQGIDYRALATCVAGGLAVCTFFTLWIVPLSYTVVDDLARRQVWIAKFAFLGREAAGRYEPVSDHLPAAGGAAPSTAAPADSVP